MNVQASCPRSGYWKELLHGNLPETLQAELTAHLDGCESCQRAVEELAAEMPLGTAVRGLARPWREPDAALQMAMDELKGKAGRTQTQGEPDQDGEIPLDFLDPPAKPGQLGKLGHYEITGVIGRGGMGVVLQAFDTVLQRVVAIKALAPQVASSAAARKRFSREAQAAAAISHEHVVHIHAVDEAHGVPYLVMEYVSGQSLQDRIDDSGPLRLPDILRIGMQAARGLAAAHAQGLIHRDIKPANILLENGVERVKLTDFGLARAVDDASLTQSGVIAGTPQYMSPEQARGEPLDHRADLFSLGSVLYAMCTGRPPFRAPSTLAVIRRVSEDTPRPVREINPEIPDWLEAIIDQLHAKAPADRIQSANEVADLLGQYLAHVQQPSRVPQPPLIAKRVTPPQKRPKQAFSPWAAVALVLAFAVLAVSVISAFAFFALLAGGDSQKAVGESPTAVGSSPTVEVLAGDGPDARVDIIIEDQTGNRFIVNGLSHRTLPVSPGTVKVRATMNGEVIHEEEFNLTWGATKQVKVSALKGQIGPKGQRTQGKANKIATGLLKDDVTWNLDVLEASYDIVETRYDRANRRVIWTVKAKLGIGTQREYQAVFHQDGSNFTNRLCAFPLEWVVSPQDAKSPLRLELDLDRIQRAQEDQRLITETTRVEIERREAADKLKPGETTVRPFGPYDRPISSPRKHGGLDGWLFHLTKDQEGRPLRLFEITDPGVEGECRLVLRAKLKTTRSLRTAYLELSCRFPDGHEATSTKPSVMAGGDTDWTTYDVTLSLKKGERPDLIRVHVVPAELDAEVRGAAYAPILIKDVVLLKAPPVAGKE